eukprot:m.96311 g.96311  ORF g.96311 m.96311 type:complete len:1964 (-) comp15185_c0_seq1:166-6057(-)
MPRQRLTPVAWVAMTLALTVGLAPAVHAALFPDPEPLFNMPVSATETCTTGTAEYSCNNTCPLKTQAFGDDLSSQVAPECACSDQYPIALTDTVCCNDDSSACLGRVNSQGHPPQLANDGDFDTYWQTLVRQDEAAITIDLLIERELSLVTLHFLGAAPAAFILERSQDGTNFEAYQYFAVDCENTFGLPTDGALTAADDVICVASEAAKVPSRVTEVSFSPVSSSRRAKAKNTYVRSEVLQRFARARYLRVSLRQLYDATTAVDAFGQPVETVPFYRLAEIEVLSRCSCNGHAEVCSADDDDELECVCSHNTAGVNCEECLPLFNNREWQRGIDSANPNECERCECNSHTLVCEYSAQTANMTGVGGVCVNCEDNTAGQFCESCLTQFYKNPAVDRSASDSCLPCGCSASGSSGNQTCNLETGQCPCKSNAMGRQCDQCKDEFYGLDASLTEGCLECDCNTVGTVGGSNLCDKVTGQCPCLDSTTGRRCDQCAVGFFLPAARLPGQCEDCHPECGDLGCQLSGNKLHTACHNCANVLDGDHCVAECPAFKYADNHTVCQDCHPDCVGGCTGPDPTSFDCTGGCQNFALAASLGGKCVESCPLDTYTSANRTCELCDKECLFCTGPRPDQCPACRNAEVDNTCVATCPPNTYKDDNNKCQPCSPSCDDSAGCSGPASHQCEKCEDWTSLANPLHAADCVAACPALTYEGKQAVGSGNETDVCLACHSECRSACSGPSNAECVGECKNFKFNGTCVPACPAHTYLDGTFCLPCSAGCDATLGCTGPADTQCAECGDHAVQFNQDTSTQCLLECPSEFYSDASNICQACHEQCEGCTAGTSSHCIRCANFLEPTTGECVASCPLNSHVVEGSVVVADADFNAVNVTQFECAPCDEECFGGCTDFGNDACKLCKRVSWNGACYPECPVGSYLGEDSTCETCHSLCGDEGCFDAGPASCHSCSTLREGDTCVSACSPDHFALNTTCQPCSNQCSQGDPGCSSPAARDCFTCQSFRNALDNVCVAECPHGTYASGSICKECNEECDGCSGPTNTQCDACRHVSFDETCLLTCPAGMYADNEDVCHTCDTECAADCVGPGANQCVPVDDGPRCQNFFRKSTLECVATCDLTHDFVGDDDPTVCRPCHPQCGNFGCTGPTHSDCRACANALFEGSCLAACPNDHFADSEGNCQPCDAQCTGLGDGNATSQGFNNPFCTQAGPEHCAACRHFDSDGTCVASCDDTTRFPTPDGKCETCHPQCKGGCHAAENTDCDECKAWTFEGACVSSCPADDSYSEVATAICHPCHDQCDTSFGSGGCPFGVERSDCRRCKHVRSDGNCLETCPQNHFASLDDTSTALAGVCVECDSQCNPLQGCTGPNPDDCNQCLNLIQDGQCVDSCDAAHYLSNQVCESCSELCLLGCDGPGADNCLPKEGALVETAASYGCTAFALVTPTSVTCKAACDTGTYADGEGLCRKCSSSCGVELGCSGPDVDDCVSCEVDQYLSAVDRLCYSCSEQCAEGGCIGPDPKHCRRCLGVRLGDDCVDNCDEALNHDRFLDSTGDEVRCLKCHPQCADGGCSGAGPNQCLGGCDNVIDFGLSAYQPDGACIASCGTNTFVNNVPSPNTCHPCAEECLNGCTGPAAVECLDCAVVRGRDGICAKSCQLNEIAVERECVCAPNTVLGASGCQTCHSECRDGCSSPNNAASCFTCTNVRRQGVCVTACEDDEVESAEGVCQACHAQCQDGCSGPNDATKCTKCSSYVDNGACVTDCPSSRPFAVPDPTAADGRCQAECPLGARYYNDTRDAATGTGPPLMPQLCVADCAELGPLRAFVSSGSFMCTTQQRAAQASGDSGTDTNVIIVAAVVGGIAFLLLLLVLCLACRRRKQSSVHEVSTMSYKQRDSVTDFGGGSELYFDPSDPSWSSAGQHDARRAYLDTSFLPSSSSPDPYMEVNTNSYSPAPGTDVQSTHM